VNVFTRSSPIFARLPRLDPLGITTKLSCVLVGWPALPNEIRLLAPLSLLNEAVVEFILVVRTSILFCVTVDAGRPSHITPFERLSAWVCEFVLEGLIYKFLIL